jgi:hypothetical protein
VLSGLWSDGTGGIKGAKMGITQMAQRIKQIHPDYVLIFKVGAFCNTFGKDSYIIASTFDYMIKRKKMFLLVAFLKKYFGKVVSTLEEKKINYLIIDPRNNYDVDEKCPV